MVTDKEFTKKEEEYFRYCSGGNLQAQLLSCMKNRKKTCFLISKVKGGAPPYECKVAPTK